MTRDNDRVVSLRHEKCNLGPLQEEIRLEFDQVAKVFRLLGTVPGSLSPTALRNSQRVEILKLLAYAIRAGQRLSMAATANNNAFKVLAGSPAFPRIQRAEFFSILFDMQREGLITEQEYDNKGKKGFKALALTPAGEEATM
jgi:hypothetical protein